MSLQKLDWLSQEQHRKIVRVIMIYKILCNKVAISFDQHRTPITPFTRGHSQQFQQVAAWVDVYLNSTISD